MMLHRGTMKMLSDLISPKALERLLSDGARERNTTLSALDIGTLQDILKRDIYRRLQLSIPAALAKRRVQEVLDSLSQEQLQETVAGHSTQILTLEDQAKQFALYFDWPETQRLRAVLSVARQTSAEGRDAETLLLEGSELIENLERKLSEGLVTQGQDLSELKASMARVSGVGGPKIKRLDALIRQISEAQESRILLPAEVERALALTLTLRKQVESSVVQQLKSNQQREMVDSLNLGPEEVQPFDLSLLPPEAQARVQTLEREHEARLLSELTREYASLLPLNAAYAQELQALRQRSDGGEVLGEEVTTLRGQLADARTEAIQAQQGHLDTLALRLSELRGPPGDTAHGDDAAQVARQGLLVARQTLQGGALATDELAQLSELVRTLETGDSLERERLMALQRETFELERRAREVPGALGDLAPLIETARATLAAGRVADLEPLWSVLERRMGEAAQQRENMDARAERVMQDYNRYRHLAGETIQKLGRLADVLRGQQRLGVLSSDARSRYIQTLENAEALLTEAHAEFQAARDVTATFGADALSDLLGVFDPEAFDGQDPAADLLSTSSFSAPEPASSAEVTAADLSGGLSSSLNDDPFGLGLNDRPLGHPGSSLVLPSFETSQPFPVASRDFGQPEQPGAASYATPGLQPAGHADAGPLELISGLVRSWLVEQGTVTQGDLSPAGDWATETECEADVLRLAWLAGQAAELFPSRLSLETPGRSWLVTPQSAGGMLVVCAPDPQRASEAAGRWKSRVAQQH
ncbi:hypothetical protein Q0M94_04415 [Deinococcus radiomollis]|uniref:hypothetical protein n=1 Tax=Deinococcus radiomollis TaxID=468916 RepID=UPI0038919D69